ncbi:bone morphogenetic protein 10-like [Rhopilema esculentum]|uniref:bone morphogenetic protein 10-like n=1 Tax=Rhopilema esculentum TaxID=499914 RepID=UPI0031E3882C
MVIVNALFLNFYLLMLLSSKCFLHVGTAPTSKSFERIHKGESEHEISRKVVAPKYMTDLYDIFVDRHGRRREGITTRINKVRCFLSDPSANFRRRQELAFDVRDIAGGETIERAELQLFKSRPFSKSHQRGFFQVEIIDVASGEKEAVRILNSYGGGWKSFDLTNAVKKWQRRMSTRNLIQVKVTGHTDDGFFVYRGETTERLPFLVVYSQSGSSRRKQHNSAAFNMFPSSLSVPKPDRGPRNKRGSNGHPCKRKSMIVDTTKIGWGRYVLAPRIFDAYRCEGKCRAYSSQAVKKQTNHAVIQAILSQLGAKQNGRQIRPPCCAPSQFENKTLLLHRKVNGQSVIGVEEFTDMVVKSCACL